MEYLEQCYTLIKSEEAFRYQELINPIQKRVSREIESFGVVTASLTGNREGIATSLELIECNIKINIFDKPIFKQIPRHPPKPLSSRWLYSLLEVS